MIKYLGQEVINQRIKELLLQFCDYCMIMHYVFIAEFMIRENSL